MPFVICSLATSTERWSESVPHTSFTHHVSPHPPPRRPHPILLIAPRCQFIERYLTFFLLLPANIREQNVFYNFISSFHIIHSCDLALWLAWNVLSWVTMSSGDDKPQKHHYLTSYQEYIYLVGWLNFFVLFCFIWLGLVWFRDSVLLCNPGLLNLLWVFLPLFLAGITSMYHCQSHSALPPISFKFPFCWDSNVEVFCKYVIQTGWLAFETALSWYPATPLKLHRFTKQSCFLSNKSKLESPNFQAHPSTCIMPCNICKCPGCSFLDSRVKIFQAYHQRVQGATVNCGLCQLRRVFTNCSQHKGSCFLVDTLQREENKPRI